MRPKTLSVCLLWLTLTLLPSALVQAQEPVAAPRLLPPDVHAYVATPSVTDLKAKWQQSLLGQLRDDPAVADFWRDVETQFQEASDKVRQELGVGLDDLLELPSGQVALAVLQPPGGKLGLVAFLDFGENGATLDKLIEKAQTALTDQGAKRSVQDVADTQVFVYALPADDDAAPDDGPARTLAYFTKQTTLAVSNDVKVLESVLARWSGDHPETFAENDTFQYIVGQCRQDDSEPVMTWYLNPIGLATAAVNTLGQQNVQAQMAMGFLPVLGLNRLKAVGGCLHVATGPFDSVSRTQAFVELPADGVLQAFEFPATEQSPPKWVPADVAAYLGMNWDLNAAYGAVEGLVDKFQGPGTFASLIAALAEKEDGPKLHLKNDLLDHLSGRIHVVVDPPADNPEQERVLIALGAKNADRLKAAVEAIAATPGFPGKAREFRGHTVYDLPKPGAAGGDDALGGLSVANEHLLITSDVTLLEQVLRGEADRPALVDSAEYKQMAAHFPAKTSIVGFQRQERQLEAVYEMLRSGEHGELVPGIDFTKLPPFEAIRKYLPATGTYVVPDRNGVQFVSFSLRNKRG